ncbi:prepilin-type N-terminal cleavage/methylation domain-containing protein [bacterium]|jgi:prepilin-type N-terminal cleavage/methylation domain-containing protein|nr:prepilin-type N-terminal cleavage/methylation domain-containing protein [bacterium]
MSKKQFAFTLIELLVVIAIIGILSGLIVVSMSGVTQKANIAKAQVFSNSLRNTLMLDLISEWRFDELTTAVDGTIIQDSWSGGNNGTLDINLVVADTADKLKSGSDCVSGKCLYFDGVDDFVSIGTNNNLRFTTAMTIESWIKTSSIASIQDIISKQGSYDFEIQTDGKLVAALTTNETWHFTQPSNSVLSINTWYHVVGTYDSSVNKFKFYINGIMDKEDSTNSTGPIVANGSSVQLGYYNSSFPDRFIGIMDQIRVYNKAIPISQIKEQYYAGLNNLLINGGIAKEEYLSRINNIANK